MSSSPVAWGLVEGQKEWVNAFWAVIDYILPNVQTVSHNVYQQGAGQSDA